MKLIIETTRLCNSRCVSCDIWQETPRDETALADLLRAVASVSATVRWIALTGGEVSLYRNLPALCRGLAAACPKLALINIPFNGINPERGAGLVARITSENPHITFHVTLSVDGIGADQDALRGHGQWKQTEIAWRRLRELRVGHTNLRVSVQLTVSRLNIDKAQEVADRFAAESDTFIIAFAMENGFYGNAGTSPSPSPRTASPFVMVDARPVPARPTLELRPSDAPKVTDLVARYRVSGLGGLLEKLFLQGMLRRLGHGSARVQCVAGRQVIFVSAQGDVQPCPFFGSSMGRLPGAAYNLGALLRSPKAIAVSEAARTCDRCWNNCVGLPSLMASPSSALRLLMGFEWHR